MDYDTWYQDEEDCIMGVDVAFGGSSNTAITICRIKRPPPKDDIIAVQNYEPVIEVILSEVYSKPDFNQIVGRILWLMDKAVCRWCLIDASAPEVLRALCLQTNQRLDWLDELKGWEDRGINVLHPHTPDGYFSGRFYPLVFSKIHRQLLQHCRRLVDGEFLAIPRKWDRLIADLRMATDFDDVLKKNNRTPMYALDSLRVCLWYYLIDDQSPDYKSQTAPSRYD